MQRVQLIDKQGKTCFDSASFVADSLVDWNFLLVEAASGRLAMRLEPSTDASAAAGSTSSSSNPPTGELQDLLHYLLDRGAEVNFGNGLAHPALLAAVDFGHEPAVRLLLDLGVPFHGYALWQAARLPQPDIARTLLEHRPAVTVVNVNQITDVDLNNLLFDAAFSGHLALVPILLDGGAVVDAIQPQNGICALAAAVDSGHGDTVLALLDRGADANVTFLNGRTALMIATLRGDVLLTQILLYYGADPNAARSDNGCTALMVATSLGNVGLTQILLDSGADPNAARTDDGATALLMATSLGNVGLTQILLDRGADPNAARSDDGATALMMATSRGNVDLTQILLDRGADPNAARSDDGGTALMVATVLQNVDLMQILLDRGADPNVARSDSGVTALMVATVLQNVDLMQILLDRGADPNAARTNSGSTALTDVAQLGYWNLMDLLREAGAEMDATNLAGQSARTIAADFLRPLATHMMRGEGMAELTRATEEGRASPSRVAALLEISATAPARAGDNTVNKVDWAALIKMAVQSGNVHIAREILAARASIDLENTAPSFDLSAQLNVAVDALNWGMMDLLREFGAQIDAPVGDTNTTSLDLAVNALSIQMTEIMALQLNNHLMRQLTGNEALQENMLAEFEDAFLTATQGAIQGAMQGPIQAFNQEAASAAIQMQNAVSMNGILNAHLINVSRHSYTGVDAAVELFIRNTLDQAPVDADGVLENHALIYLPESSNAIVVMSHPEEGHAYLAGKSPEDDGENYDFGELPSDEDVYYDIGEAHSDEEIYHDLVEASSYGNSTSVVQNSSNFASGEGIVDNFYHVMPILLVGGIGLGLGAYLPQFQNSLGCSLNPWIEHSAFGG